MHIPKLRIGNLEWDLPIVQGAMGVQISSYPLPPAVANAGAVGTIPSVGLGESSVRRSDFVRASREALIAEIERCQVMTKHPIAVNVMGAVSNARDLIETAVKSGIKMIVYGAGIPRDLPAIVPDREVSLVPIISSAKLARLLLQLWQRRYQRLPSAFIIEGPLAGGHLGFSYEQLEKPEEHKVEDILAEVLAEISPYQQKLGQRIPVIVAGGVYTGADAARMLSLGAAAVQLGIRFVVTKECPAAPGFKQAYLDARAEDVRIIKSPVGMPGRAIQNRFLSAVEAGQIELECPYHCITSCDIKTARYCIARALFNAKKGDLDNGLIFAGANVHRLDKIISVQELIDELVAGIRAA